MMSIQKYFPLHKSNLVPLVHQLKYFLSPPFLRARNCNIPRDQLATFQSTQNPRLHLRRQTFKKIILLTRTASISLSVTGVRFGRRDAFPPTAVLMGGAGTSDLDLVMKLSMMSPSLRIACLSEIEPRQQKLKTVWNINGNLETKWEWFRE